MTVTVAVAVAVAVDMGMGVYMNIENLKLTPIIANLTHFFQIR